MMYHCIKSIIQCGEKMKSDFNNNSPIYLQLIEQLKKDIISGKIPAGERLPSVRDLALQLKVNPNTMQKALVELEDMGLIYTERTNGKFVTDKSSLIKKHKQEYADIITHNYLETMKKIGFNESDVLLIIKNSKGKR